MISPFANNRSELSIQFNSVYLYSPISQITNLSRSALQSVHIRHPWPLTSHWIRKNSLKNREKKLSQGKRGKNPSGEQQRRIPLQDEQEMSSDQKEALQSYNTFNQYDRNAWIISRRHIFIYVINAYRHPLHAETRPDFTVIVHCGKNVLSGRSYHHRSLKRKT